MSDLEKLRPTRRLRVMDLVEEAGVDVSDWGNFAGGLKRAALNPKYCYEWSFLQPGKVAVLNLWHSGMRERVNTITLSDNLRKSARNHALNGHGVWEKRAAKLDRFVGIAASAELPIRVIVLDGQQREREIVGASASKVTARMLDPVPWAVTSYNQKSGEFTLTRGALPHKLVDQFTAEVSPALAPETRAVSGVAYIRSGSVRKQALDRAGGRCEWCGTYGFSLADGSVFLETHHIVPLSAGGADVISNVAALCPNHHREAHLGAAQSTIRAGLMAALDGSTMKLKNTRNRERGDN